MTHTTCVCVCICVCVCVCVCVCIYIYMHIGRGTNFNANACDLKLLLLQGSLGKLYLIIMNILLFVSVTYASRNQIYFSKGNFQVGHPCWVFNN